MPSAYFSEILGSLSSLPLPWPWPSVPRRPFFSVVHGVLLRPLPYPSPHRLMALWEINNRGTYARLADPNFNDFRDRNRTFSAVAKYAAGVTSVGGEGEPTRQTVAAVSRDFFEVLGVQPTLGRSFGPDDARIGAAPTVVVSHGYWVRSLGSSRSLSALPLRIQGRGYQIVGVMPRGFQFPAHADLWVPVELDPENRSRTSHNYHAIGRLRDGVREEQASADMSVIARDIVRQSPEQGSYLLTDAAVVSLHTSLTGRVSSTLYILLVAVSFSCSSPARTSRISCSHRAPRVSGRSPFDTRSAPDPAG